MQAYVRIVLALSMFGMVLCKIIFKVNCPGDLTLSSMILQQPYLSNRTAVSCVKRLTGLNNELTLKVV